MPIQLLTAPANSGKTEYTVNLARQTAVSLQAEVRVCVPTILQLYAWRQRLAHAGGAMGVHVFTFGQLVANCLNQAGTAYTQLSDPVLYRLLRQIIDQQSLPHYHPIKAKPGFIQMVHQLIGQLKSAQIEPDQFATAVAQLGAGPRLQELATIYNQYQQQLQNHGWADRVGLHWLASDVLAKQDLQLGRQWPLLIIDGFDDFTPAQLSFLQLLTARVQHCLITLPQAEQVSLPRYQNSWQAVQDRLQPTAVSLPNATAVPPKTSLQWLKQRLFAGPVAAPFADDGRIQMQQLPTIAAEARAALRWLKQQIVNHGRAPNSLALIARDIAPYRPFIQQIGQEFGLPLFLVAGQPLAQTPVIHALLTLMQLYLPADGNSQNPALPRRQLLASWRSPYFAWGDATDAVQAGDADALDLLARQQQVIRGLDQWQAAFATAVTAKISAADEPEADTDALSPATAEQLQQKFNRFLQNSQPKAQASIREFVQWLEALIGPDPQATGRTVLPANSLQVVAQARSNPPTAVADVAALQTLKDILRGLVWAEEATQQNRTVAYSYFFNELNGAIAANQLRLQPDAHQPHILVADVYQLRGLSFTAVAVMGLSEGSFPAILREDPILRDSDRQQLQQAGFSLQLSTFSSEREFFYEAVTRARENLLLTRPSLADNGAEWVSSPFWEEVRQLVAVQPLTVSSEAIVPLAETASWAEWWETAVAQQIAHPQLQQADTWHALQHGATIWQLRQQRQTAVYDGHLATLQPILAVEFGPDHVWSASRLETYQTCGFYFFVQYVLKQKPRPEPMEGLDVRQFGQLYHILFETVYQAGPPMELDDEALQQWVADVVEPVLQQAPRNLGFRQTAWWGRTRSEMIENVSRSIRQLHSDSYQFLQAEAAFGRPNNPLILRRAADKLQLHGYIDRIDRDANGRLRIIDYKSSGKDGYSAAVFKRGQKLQLPLYALAAEQALELGQVGEGFYWHFQVPEASRFKLSQAEEAIDTAVDYAWQAVEQIRHGRFTPNPPPGGCPSYCPAATFCWQYNPKSY